MAGYYTREQLLAAVREIAPPEGERTYQAVKPDFGPVTIRAVTLRGPRGGWRGEDFEVTDLAGTFSIEVRGGTEGSNFKPITYVRADDARSDRMAIALDACGLGEGLVAEYLLAQTRTWSVSARLSAALEKAGVALADEDWALGAVEAKLLTAAGEDKVWRVLGDRWKKLAIAKPLVPRPHLIGFILAAASSGMIDRAAGEVAAQWQAATPVGSAAGSPREIQSNHRQ